MIKKYSKHYNFNFISPEIKRSHSRESKRDGKAIDLT